MIGLQLAKLSTAYSKGIADILELEEDTVVNLLGVHGSTTVAAAGPASVGATEITAIVTVPDNSSANALAEQLYTKSFRDQMVSTTREVLAQTHGQSTVVGNLSVLAVSIKPEHMPDTTVTTTIATANSTAGISQSRGPLPGITTTFTVHYELATSSAAFLASTTAAPAIARATESQATWQFTGHSGLLFAWMLVAAGCVSTAAA